MESRTGFLISQIKQVQSRIFQRLLQESGVEEFNGPQGHILYVLWQKDEVPIVELSQKTGLAKNTLTAMLGRMEDAGLIERKAARSDKRQSLIVLTKKARDLQGKYDEVSQKMNEIFYKDFTQKEVVTIDGFLDRILLNLEQSERSAKSGKEE
ncbi:MAG: MarR family transcriptional regulator [Clostridiales bacterium]|nr:MarR family transcriptional regulator [Clostridiales bacterium]MBR5040071.1 MarR family transcriptional regulator [Clostridiales bacterium]